MHQRTSAPASPPSHDRRMFLRTSAALAAAGSLASTSLAAKPEPVHVSGSDVLRVGLVGCGGRGTGAAMQALLADENTQLVAITAA